MTSLALLSASFPSKNEHRNSPKRPAESGKPEGWNQKASRRPSENAAYFFGLSRGLSMSTRTPIAFSASTCDFAASPSGFSAR